MSRIWYRCRVPHSKFALIFKSLLQYNAGNMFLNVAPGFSNLRQFTTTCNQCQWSHQTWTWCPCCSNHFSSKNLFIFNLLSACLHPHTPTTQNTHTTKPHTPYPKIPTTICHIVILFIIFLWYKTIFSTNPHCVSLYINKEKQKNANGLPVKCHSYSMIWQNVLPNINCLCISWKERHKININK